MNVRMRQTEVAELMCRNKTTNDILHIVSQKWGVDIRTVNRDIAYCRTQFEESRIGSVTEKIARYIRRLERFIDKAEQKDDTQSTLQAIKTLIQLEGLDQVQLNVTVEDKRELPDVEPVDLDRIASDD